MEAKETEVCVASMESGRSFGEMSLLTGEPRSASIRAKTDVILYELQKETMEEIFTIQSNLPEKISKVIAEYKLRDVALRERLSVEEEQEQKKTFASELLDKMQSFFNIRT